MTTISELPVDQIDLGDPELWKDGPPHAIFERLRREAPLHWSEMADWPEETGFWSVTRWEDVLAISRDWETFSNERRGFLAVDHVVPVEVQNAIFLGMDPPRHDRIKGLFQRGFTPKRIAEHEQTVRDVARRVLDRLEGRESFDLVADLASPVVGRVIGTFLGTPEEEDEKWAVVAQRAIAFGDDVIQPDGASTVQDVLVEIVQSVMGMAAERRENPTDDLTSILVHAEIDGERLSDDEIAFGFALLVAAGNDSTKATFSNGMVALMRHPDQMATLSETPSLVPAAVEEFLRYAPAFGHFARAATRDVEMHGKTIREGDKVILWYPSSNRDESVHACPHALDITRNPEHQAFGAGGRHFCLGTALARLELRVLFEETLSRYPRLELVEEPEAVRSMFVNQPRAVHVRVPSAG